MGATKRPQQSSSQAATKVNKHTLPLHTGICGYALFVMIKMKHLCVGDSDKILFTNTVFSCPFST